MRKNPAVVCEELKEPAIAMVINKVLERKGRFVNLKRKTANKL